MSGNLFYIKVIEQYKKHPCLWDFNHTEYKDKFARHEAWKKLLAAAQSVDPKYTISSLVTKITNMRGAYRKQLRKVKKAQEAGEVFEPQLFYFNLLSFLRPHYNEWYSIDDQRTSENEESGYSNDQESAIVLEDTTSENYRASSNDNYQYSSNSTNASPMPPENSIEPEWSHLLDDFTKVKEQVVEKKYIELQNSIKTPSTETATSLLQISSACSIKNGLDSTRPSSTSQKSCKRARIEVPPPSETNEILEKLTKLIENSFEATVHKDKEKTYDSFGDYVAGKLCYMPSEMVPICQKLINDAIFYGETKNLNMTSRIVTDH